MRLLPASRLGRFFATAFLWLPVCFAIWYQLAPLLTLPAAKLSTLALNALHPGLISDQEGVGQSLRFVIGLTVPTPESAPRGAVAELIVAVNPLIYSWNLPVLMALLFASNQAGTEWRAAVGFVGLIPIHVWGVSFDVLKRLALQSGPAIQAQLNLADWQREGIALGYQFGYLMLPVIGAATIWIALNRPLLQDLVARPGHRQEGTG